MGTEEIRAFIQSLRLGEIDQWFVADLGPVVFDVGVVLEGRRGVVCSVRVLRREGPDRDAVDLVREIIETRILEATVVPFGTYTEYLAFSIRFAGDPEASMIDWTGVLLEAQTGSRPPPATWILRGPSDRSLVAPR